ncbi:hypothetical protein JCM11251_000339 [Rhodosporidiobolus azoricus]
MGWELETPEQLEIAQLKRAKQKVEEELASQQNEAAKVIEDRAELRLELKGLAARAQQEAAKSAEAEKALYQKTNAYNTLKDQKANAEAALYEAENTIKDQQKEIKRLSYELEVTSVRTADAATASLAKEKAALEKRVHQLSTDLQRAHFDLEKEKENSRNVPAPTAAQPASKIARPPSRSSTTPADSQSAGRFGFRSGIPGPPSGVPKSIRPPSSLGQNGSAPTPVRPPSALSSGIPSLKGSAQRRPSVTGSSAAPNAINTSASAQKVTQLESDLSDAKNSLQMLESSLLTAETTVSTLESSLAQAQEKLKTKSDDLLRMENQLMALERSTKDQVGQLQSDLEDARDEVEGLREEAREVADETKRELDNLAKEAKEEQKALEEEVQRLTADLARRAGEQDDADGTREELVRLVAEAREELGAVREENEELENELAYLEEQMQEMEEKMEIEATERQKLEEDLEASDNAIAEIEADNVELSSRLAQLQQEKDALVERGVPSAASSREAEELQQRLEEVLAERDELAASLDAARAAQQDVRATLDQQLSVAAGLQSELDETRTAHDTLRSDFASATHSSSESLSALNARILSLVTEVANKNVLLENADKVAATRDVDSAAMSDLQAQLEVKEHEIFQLSKRVEELEGTSADADALRTSLAEKDERLSILAIDLATARADTDRLQTASSDLAALQHHFDELVAERDDLLAQVEQQGEEASQSVDADEFEELKNALAAAETEVLALQQRLKEAETLEWGSTDALKVAEEESSALRERLAVLEAAVETEKGLAIAAKSEASAVEEALFDARRELDVSNGQLSVEMRAKKEASHECELLRTEIDELEFSLTRFGETERELAAVSAELDDLRLSSDDAALEAMHEIGELNARLREQESFVDQLERRVVEADALRRVLADTETRVDSLGWELNESRTASLEAEKQADGKVKALMQRAELAEGDADRLRMELDDLRHRLSDAQDSLDQAQAELSTATTPAAASPSPASPSRSSPTPASPSPASPTPDTPSLNRSFAFSPEADPSILILRLRDERNELRERLDFARKEAQFRTEELQTRLREAEESKAHGLSTLEMNLLDKQAAYETEVETNAKMEEVLREARREKERVVEDLDAASKKLREAERRVEDTLKRLADEEKKGELDQANREDVWVLEEELGVATKSANSARAELDAANSANEDLRNTLSSLQDDLAAALREVHTQKSLATAAGERIEQLEGALSANKEQQERSQGNALAEFAALYDTLRSDVDSLRAQIAQRDATIEQYQQKIALLQLNMAVRVAIQDDGDLNECETSTVQEEEADGAEAPSAAELLAASQGQLDDALATRSDLVRQVETLQEQLFQAKQDLDAETKSGMAQSEALADLRIQLEDAEHRASEQEEQLVKATIELAGAQQAALELRQRHETGESTRAMAAEGADETQRALTERIDELESAHDSAQTALSASRHEIAFLTSRLTATTDDLAATKEILEMTTSSLAALQERTALSSSSEELEKQIAGLTREVERLQVDADEKAVVHEQAQSRLRLLQEQLAATATERDAAQEELAAAAGSTQAEKEEQDRLVLELSSAKDQAIADLTAAREEAASLAARLDDVEQSRGSTAALEQQLAAAQNEVSALSTLVEQTRAEADEAKAALDSSASKAKSAAELATREIQTLRRLSKSSQVEAETLTAEVEGLRAKVEELTGHIDSLTESSQVQLQQLRDESRKNIEEVIHALEACENDKAAVEEQVRVLERQIKELSESAPVAQSSGEAEQRVAELEQQLEAKMVDVEEADERVLEALKAQKRYTSQIERLKAKIASLQRDLATAKASPPPVPTMAVPLPAPPAAPSSNKKRRAPQDFDGLPAPIPRAIVASSVPALDQENAGREVRRVPRSRSPSKMASKADGVVPLKPEQVPVFGAATKPLQPVDENASFVPLAASIPAAKAAPATKVASLKARMQAQKREREAAAAAAV